MFAAVAVPLSAVAQLPRWAVHELEREAMSAPRSPDWTPPARWLVEIPFDRLEAIGNTESFWTLLRLARHVNAFRFGQGALYRAQDDDSPAGVRQRSAAFFFHGGVLYEALKMIPDLRVHFGANPHWDRSFGRYGTDEDVRAQYAQGTVLHRLRNHVSYHVLPMVPEKSWPRLALPQFVFVRAHGHSVGSLYYELADTVALHYVLGAPATYDGFLQSFKRVGGEITTKMLAFAEAADILIPRALQAWGLSPREDVDPTS